MSKNLFKELNEKTIIERNEQVKEYGWRVKTEMPAPLSNVEDDDIFDRPEIDGLSLETHPMDPDYVFIAFNDPDSFDVEEAPKHLPSEPVKLRAKVEKFVKRLIPDAKLVWSFIKTER